MGESIESSSPKSIKEAFEDACPYFMAIGMTFEQFWEDSPFLCQMFLKADKIRQKRENEKLWLQGYYFYTALCDVSPVLQAFAKKGTKPLSYLKKPLAMTKEDLEEQEREEKIERQQKFYNYLLQHSKRKGE